MNLNRIVRIALIGAAALTVTVGCRARSEKKEAETLVQEANEKIAQSHANNQYLLDHYNIDLSESPSKVKAHAEKEDWVHATEEQRKDIRKHLDLQLSLSGRVREIEMHKNIKSTGGNGVGERYLINAKCYRDYLDKAEGRTPS